MSKDESIWNATSAYIYDIYINENMVSAAYVKEHLAEYRLTYKDQE